MEMVNPDTGEVTATECDQSPSIGALACALAKAQGVMKPASESEENPFFKSSYAGLVQVWESCRKPLSENGLAVIQTTSCEREMVVVMTTLAHASGEWIRGRIALKPTKSDPQGIGSAITYGRRYGLSALVGVTSQSEDDDGNSASEPEKKAAPKAVKTDPKFVTDAQCQMLYASCTKNGVTPEQAKAYLKENFKVSSAKEIKKADFDTILAWVTAQAKPQGEENV